MCCFELIDFMSSNGKLRLWRHLRGPWLHANCDRPGKLEQEQDQIVPAPSQINPPNWCDSHALSTTRYQGKLEQDQDQNWFGIE